jgi:hypothetical protein
MSKASYTLEKDGSITFHDEKVSDDVRAKAYSEAARERAHATNVPEEEVEQIVRENAELAVSQRETGTEVQK